MVMREANSCEIDELVEFYDRMCKVLANSPFLPNGNKGGYPSREMIEGAVKNKEQYVGVVDGKIVAAYILNHDCDPAYDKANWQISAARSEVMVLHALRVMPEYGGRGYAKRLMEHALSVAKSKNQKAIRLDCVDGNTAAQKLYLSFGFKNIGSVPIFYEDIGTEVDCLLFELSL